MQRNYNRGKRWRFISQDKGHVYNYGAVGSIRWAIFLRVFYDDPVVSASDGSPGPRVSKAVSSIKLSNITLQSHAN
jgi:hypothetical protein